MYFMYNCSLFLGTFVCVCVCVYFVVSFYKWNTQAQYVLGFPAGSAVRNLPAHVGDLGSIPGLGKSPGEEMASHASILVWENPWTEEPAGLQFMGSQRVRHCWATKQQYVLAKFTSLFHKEWLLWFLNVSVCTFIIHLKTLMAVYSMPGTPVSCCLLLLLLSRFSRVRLCAIP